MRTNYAIFSSDMWHEINEEFGKKGGVYLLKCSNKSQELQDVIAINRLLKTDSEGILYIGKASSFLVRVAELKKSISPDYESSSHECGARYKSNPLISAKFPFKNLFVKLIPSDDPRSLEFELLSKYEREFGELPPLNRCS
jgi:hypothetical protein